MMHAMIRIYFALNIPQAAIQRQMKETNKMSKRHPNQQFDPWDKYIKKSNLYVNMVQINFSQGWNANHS